MIPIWPLKPFEFEISISWTAPLLSTYQMSPLHRIVCLLYCAYHFPVTSVLPPWFLTYSTMALGKFFNFSIPCLPLQFLFISFSLTACFCQVHNSCSHLRALALMFPFPVTSTGFLSSSTSQLKYQLLEGFFSWIPPAHLR